MFGLMRRATHEARLVKALERDFTNRVVLRAVGVQLRQERDLALQRVEAVLALVSASKGATVGKQAIEDALILKPVPKWVQAYRDAKEAS